jgi:hypothetical protein
MAAPAQSPLRRWKPFFRAFESVDAAIEAFDPVEFSRHELRSARGDIVERLCDAADDDQAERLCLLLDDMMAESLETLRLIPLMPTVLAKTDLAKCVRALHKNHESERVRVLAGGIVAAWRASVQDDDAKVREVTHKVENLPQPKTMDHRTQPAKIPETSAKKTVRNAMPPKLLDNLPQQLKTMDHPTQPAKIPETPAKKKTAEITTNRASDPVAPGLIFRGDRAGLVSDEKMLAAKRKFNQAYREAEDAKRQRLPIKVVAPEMIKQMQKRKHPILRERSQARCGSSMVKKTLTVTRLPSHHRV